MIALCVSKPLWFIKFEGVENIPPPSLGPVVVAANHQTYMDPVWLSIPLKGRKLRFMAFDVAFGWPIVGPLIRFLGAFPVALSGSRAKIAYKESLTSLRAGATLIIFPEGAREFEDGQLLPFREGAARIALAAGVPVLPATISGGNLIWPQGRKFPRFFRRVTIRFHPPVIDGVSRKDDKRVLLNAIRDAISDQ